MNITLNPELEQLIQSQLKTGKYKTAEQVLGEALRLLAETARILRLVINDSSVDESPTGFKNVVDSWYININL